MEKKKNRFYTRLIMILISTLNTLSALMHFIFEFQLMNRSDSLREFILIENLLITAVFIYFAVAIIIYDIEKKINLLKLHLLFWIVLLLAAIIFPVQNSSLSLLKNFLPFSQSTGLIITGIYGTAVSGFSLMVLKKIKKSLLI